MAAGQVRGLVHRAWCILLSAALLLTAPGLEFYRACAQNAASETPAEALLRRLGAAGILKPGADPLKPYIVADGKLTALGRFLAAYEGFKAASAADPKAGFDRHAAARTDADIRKAFAELRAAGGAGEGIAQKRQAIEKLAERLESMGMASPHTAYTAVSQMMTVLTGARQTAGGSDADLSVVYVDDTAEYYDAQGRLYGVVNRQGRVLRSRQVEEQQIEFNRKNIPGAPRLAVTGVMDVPTLAAPYYEFQDQIQRFERAFHFDRTYALAEILHKDTQYRPQQFDPLIQERERQERVRAGEQDAKTLEAEFLVEHPGGSRYQAQQLLDPTFNQRGEYLKRAAAGLEQFKAFVESWKGKGSIPDPVVKQIELQQRDIGRLLTAAYLAGEEYHLKHAKAKLFSAEMNQALGQAPGATAWKFFESEQNQRLQAVRPRLAQRLDAVAAQVVQMRRELDKLSLNLDPDDPRLGEVEARLETLGAYLASVEGQDRQVLDDASTYAAAIGHYTASHKAAHASWAVQGWNWAAGIVAPGSERVVRTQAIRAGAEKLSGAFQAIQDGDFATAKGAFGTLAPDAWKTRRNVPLLGGANGPAASEVSAEEKIQYSLEAYGEMVGVQTKQDFWIEFGGDLLKGAAMTALAAPALAQSATMLGSRLIAAGTELALVGGGFWRSAGSAALRGGGEILVNSGTLLSNLSDKKWVAGPFRRDERLTVFYNALRTELAVSANLAAISGALQAWQAGSPTSPFRSRGEAFVEGAKGGAQFVAENPWMLYVGLPTTIVGRGNAVSRVLSNYGESGLVGGSFRTLSNVFRRDFDPVGRFAGWMGKGGAVGQFGSFMTVTADQVAKYYAGAHLMGAAVKNLVYYGSEAGNPEAWGSQRKDNGRLKVLDPEQIQRARARIDRAERAALFTMSWGWLVIPTAPAVGGAQRREQLLAETGFWEHKAGGKLHELVNAEGAHRTLDTVPRTSLVDVIFGRHSEKGPAHENTWQVSAKHDREATVWSLKRIAPTLGQMFRLTQLADGAVAGPLKPRRTWKNPKVKEYEWTIQGSDKVREQAQVLFERMALKDPVRAEKLLRRMNEGAGIRQDIARIYLEAFGPQNRGAFGRTWLALRGALNGFTAAGRARRRAVAASGQILASHLRTEKSVNEHAEVLVAKVTALDGVTPAYQERVDALVKATREWRRAKEKNPAHAEFETVLRSWNAEAQADGRLSKAQKEVLGAAADYYQALSRRFREAEIRNVKGYRIEGFRPKQTDVLVQFLSALVATGPAQEGSLLQTPGRALRQAAGGDWRVMAVNRQYLLLATGGGKTLLAFEGILPIAKADAKAKGKKLAYMTATSNLVAQARLDYKSFKKLLTKLEILTMDEFTTRLAQGRFMGGDRAEDYYLLTDELDKMAEDAVKTIGQAGIRIDPKNDSYKGLENLHKKIQGTIAKIGESPAPGLGTRVKRVARFLIGGALGNPTRVEMGAKARADLKRLQAQHAELLAEAARHGQVPEPRLAQAQRLQQIIDGMAAQAGTARRDWRAAMENALARHESAAAGSKELGQLARQAHNTVTRAGGRGTRQRVARQVPGARQSGGGGAGNRVGRDGVLRTYGFERAREILDGIALRHERALEAAHLPAAAKAELRRAFSEIAGSLSAKEAALHVGELSAEYRRTLPQAVQSRSPLYESIREADGRIARWMNSPLRKTNDARMEWAQELSAIGRDVQRLVEKHLDSRGAGSGARGQQDRFGEVRGEGQSLEQGAALARRQRELLAKGRIPSRDSHQRPGVGLERAGVPASSPYRIRDAAKAAELEGVLRQMLEAGWRGAPKAEVAALAQRYEQLLPEAVVAVDWAQVFDAQLTAMTKEYAAKWDAIAAADPYFTNAEKGRLKGDFLSSQKTGRGWVYDRLLNLAYGYKEEPASVRYDSKDQRVHIVHVGEWARDMDTPTRWRWELRYETALTWPYEHRAKANVRDLSANPKANLVAFSGTKQELLDLTGATLLGEATARQPARASAFRAPSEMMQEAVRGVLARAKSKTKLTFVGFANNRELKVFKRALEKAGMDRRAVAQIFSDTEYLRTKRPQSNVVEQMNLGGLKTGEVKVVLVNVWNGGRGLDLDFKSYGKASGWKQEGYKDVEMIVLNPYKLSPGHYVQFQGRIAPDRLLGGGKGEPKVKPNYRDFIDMAEAAENPVLKDLAQEKGARLDADFLTGNLEAAQSAVQRELLENSEAISRGRAFWKTGLRGLTR